MSELHTRLLTDVITLGSPYPLVLTGGYAVRAWPREPPPPGPRCSAAATSRSRFEREDLQSNLTGAEWTGDEAFAAYGLDEVAISEGGTGRCPASCCGENGWPSPVCRSPRPPLQSDYTIGWPQRAQVRLVEPERVTGSALRLLIGPTLVACPQLVEVETSS
ncbi:hypothetical protein [Streptomyces sp. NPDC053813]|uniref:hypothetical protein n=1 Tax=Streptomyces sp. NPDC053813 TaxID=3365717 RepID=UPI0037D08179